jgi:hypothetical protein
MLQESLTIDQLATLHSYLRIYYKLATQPITSKKSILIAFEDR